ncbi:MAG: hypothetical protein LC737_09270, partial [Chloroflexi bacterium]|nr:hypothetical protein [Chloroflexota bacterium]
MLNDLRRRPFFLPLLAFIVGTLFGWWALGWGLFPVEYKDADPHGLSAANKREYVQMVADSFAIDQDAATAQRRLASFSRQELTALLSDMRADLQ